MKQSLILLIVLLCIVSLCIVCVICIIRENENSYKELMFLLIGLMLVITGFIVSIEYGKAIIKENKDIAVIQQKASYK